MHQHWMINLTKKILFFLLSVFFVQNICSEDKKDSSFFLEGSLRLIWPELSSPDLMGFFNIGGGVHHTIIPNIISPGIYFDLGIGYDWMKIFSNEEFDVEKEKNTEFNQFGLNLGCRFYNLIEIDIVNINMFFGYNLLLGQLDKRVNPIIHNPIMGVSVSIKFIALEYAYYIPTKYSNYTTFHHISLVIHFTDNILNKD
jgi:hypothetical protein